MTFMSTYVKVLNKLSELGGKHEENSGFIIRRY